MTRPKIKITVPVEVVVAVALTARDPGDQDLPVVMPEEWRREADDPAF